MRELMKTGGRKGIGKANIRQMRARKFTISLTASIIQHHDIPFPQLAFSGLVKKDFR